MQQVHDLRDDTRYKARWGGGKKSGQEEPTAITREVEIRYQIRLVMIGLAFGLWELWARYRKMGISWCGRASQVDSTYYIRVLCVSALAGADWKESITLGALRTLWRWEPSSRERIPKRRGLVNGDGRRRRRWTLGGPVLLTSRWRRWRCCCSISYALRKVGKKQGLRLIGWWL